MTKQQRDDIWQRNCREEHRLMKLRPDQASPLMTRGEPAPSWYKDVGHWNAMRQIYFETSVRDPVYASM